MRRGMSRLFSVCQQNSCCTEVEKMAMSTVSIPLNLYSMGEVAERYWLTRDQAAYAAQAERIEPTVVAGHRRVYDERAAERIRSAVTRIQENRRHGGGGNS